MHMQPDSDQHISLYTIGTITCADTHTLTDQDLATLPCISMPSSSPLDPHNVQLPSHHSEEEYVK